MRYVELGEMPFSQISHHPPVSAFYVTNRQEGYVFSGCILAKSKFYGNSLSAIMDGSAHLMFLTRGEEYVITMPYAHCKGSATNNSGLFSAQALQVVLQTLLVFSLHRLCR